MLNTAITPVRDGERELSYNIPPAGWVDNGGGRGYSMGFGR